MSRCKNGNPKKSSRFICLRCLKVNNVGSGIQRPNQKEEDHRKDLVCLCTKLQEKTKNLEVRYCDDLGEKMEEAARLHEELYGEIVD